MDGDSPLAPFANCFNQGVMYGAMLALYVVGAASGILYGCLVSLRLLYINIIGGIKAINTHARSE